MPRVFIPAGAWRPDEKALRNPGLRRAYGVLPFGDSSYLVAPGFTRGNSSLLAGDHPLGSFIHTNLNGDFFYYGDSAQLYEINMLPMSETPRGSGVYDFGGIGSGDMWWFTAYGDNVVATNFYDPVQYVSSPPGPFSAMITSTFKPQFRFSFPLRQNLFGCYCFLPSTYDGLAAGTHEWLVVWSQNDNLRVFGSESVDPSQVGAGYQPLGNDLGPITAAFGAGEYGLIFQKGGITRVEGPPYEFRTIDRDDSSYYPYSVQTYRGDVYFWGNGGPAVLRGGEGGAVPLVDGVALRTLAAAAETSDAFSEIERELSEDNARAISCAVDRVNGIIRWSILPKTTSYIVTSVASTPVRASGAVLDYHVASGRFSISPLSPSPTANAVSQAFFLQVRPPDFGAPWGPHRTTYFIEPIYNASGIVDYALSLFSMNTTNRPPIELQTGLGQLAEDKTVQIRRVRPVYSRGTGSSAVTTEVNLGVTNNPHGGPETPQGPFATQDEHGWIACQDAPYVDFNAIAMKLDPNLTGDGKYIAEIEGFEVEYAEGGSYGA